MAKSPSTPGKVSGETPRKAPPPAPAEAISNSFAEPQAAGGETHQVADGDVAVLTTAHLEMMNIEKRPYRAKTELADLRIRQITPKQIDQQRSN